MYFIYLFIILFTNRILFFLINSCPVQNKLNGLHIRLFIGSIKSKALYWLRMVLMIHLTNKLIILLPVLSCGCGNVRISVFYIPVKSRVFVRHSSGPLVLTVKKKNNALLKTVTTCCLVFAENAMFVLTASFTGDEPSFQDTLVAERWFWQTG